MKKTIAKILFIVICMAAIIFLLLPFLETTPPATTDLKSAAPQVGSSNPLAVIAQRLASLFKRPSRERKAQLLASRNSYPPNQPHWQFDVLNALPPADQRLAKTRTVADLTADEQHVAVPPVSPDEYGNASLLTDEGEWVLIRQTAPQPGILGMHEVNVHENPYDRYVKQEQVRRFQPPSQQASIPDSKWARLLRPVKEFLGIEEAQPVGNSALAFYREGRVAQTADSSFLTSNTDYAASSGGRRSSWPTRTPAQWARMSEAERQQERERRSAAEFVEIMSGTRGAEEAAAIEAAAAYPDPKDEAKRESYRQQLTEEKKQAIKEGLLAAMRANAQGKQQVDELGQIMNGCENASLPKQNCNSDQPQNSGSLFSSDEVAAWQEKSRQIFLAKTHYKMPDNLPLMPVLGPTTPETIAAMGGVDDVEKTAGIYQFMYDKNNCASQDCFLIPNSIQSNEQLADALKLANMNLVTDLDNLYLPHKEEFIRYDVEKAQKQQPEDPAAQLSEEELRKQAEKKFTENAPNWIFVTSQQLKDIYTVHTLQAANPKNADKNIPVAVLYQTNPVYAEKMYHAVGDSPIFGFAKEPLTSVVSSADDPRQADKETVENTSELTRDSVTDNFHTAFVEAGKVMKQSVAEGAKAGVKKRNPKSENPSGGTPPSGKK